MYRIADWLLNSRRRRRRSMSSKRLPKTNLDHATIIQGEYEQLMVANSRQPIAFGPIYTPKPKNQAKFSELDDYYLSFQRIRSETPQFSSAPPSTQLKIRNPNRLDVPTSDYASLNKSLGRPAIRTNPWVAPRSPNSPQLDWQTLTPSPALKTPEKLSKSPIPHPSDDLSSSGYSSHDSSPESSLYSPRWAATPKPTVFVPLGANRRSIAEQERSIDISYENICEVILEESQQQEGEKVDKCVECTIDCDSDDDSCCVDCDGNGPETDDNGNRIDGDEYLSDDAVFLLAELDRKLFDLRARTRQVAKSARRAEDEYRRYERSREVLNQNLTALRSLKWVIHGTDMHF